MAHGGTWIWGYILEAWTVGQCDRNAMHHLTIATTLVLAVSFWVVLWYGCKMLWQWSHR